MKTHHLNARSAKFSRSAKSGLGQSPVHSWNARLFCKRALVVAISDALMMSPSVSWADPVAANSATRVYEAPNGVPVVDIATANASGMSHNQFNRYDVDHRGVVLNNANASQPVRDSQLAGQVLFNPHLKNEANLILNEVVAPNRSRLDGYTEVVGSSADVVVANPYGITCSGCGFINTPNATLTTGQPQVTGGRLTGFDVKGGDILVTGNGLDATQSDYLGLIARGVKVDGQINARDLQIAAGTQVFDYTERTSGESDNGDNAAPSVAIDSTLLGGMYAQRIQLQSTEAGVGVRMLGEAAATSSDFTIDASGKVVLGAAISAQRDVKISSDSAAVDAIRTDNAGIAAKRNVDIEAENGGVQMRGGAVAAGEALAVAATQLNDVSVASENTDQNKRYGAKGVSIVMEDAFALDGTHWTSGSHLVSRSGSVGVGSQGATFSAGGDLSLTTDDGGMALGQAALSSKGDLTLDSAGNISTAAGASQGIRSGQDLVLLAEGGFSNAGVVSAKDGSATIGVNGEIDNSGTVHAASDIVIADREGQFTGVNVSNSGRLIADEHLNIRSQEIDNSGEISAATGTAVNAVVLNNQGTWIASNQTDATDSVIAEQFTNSGILQSAGTLAMASGQLINTASGRILSAGALTLRGSTDAVYNVGSAGRIQAGGALDIRGAYATDHVDIDLSGAGILLGESVYIDADHLAINGDLINDVTSGITSNGNLDVFANSLVIGNENSYMVAAANGVGMGTITVDSEFTNAGVLHSGEDLSVTAYSIANTATGGISALNDLTLRAWYETTHETNLGTLYNAGALYAGHQMDVTSMSSFWNYGTNDGPLGTIDSDGGIVVHAGSFTNSSTVNATGDITIDAGSFLNSAFLSDPRMMEQVSSVTRNYQLGELRWVDLDGNGSNESQVLVTFWEEQQVYRQYYENDEAPAYAPQLIGGGTVTIQNFYNGANRAGVISGNVVTLDGINEYSRFVNDDLSLATITQAVHYENWECHISTWPCFITYRNWQTLPDNTVGIPGTGLSAVIHATELNGDDFHLENNSNPIEAVVESIEEEGATSIGGSESLPFEGLILDIPSNPNGHFILSEDPDAHYLIETNPHFTHGYGLGSDYLAEQLGYDPDDVQRRLGDAAYENYLIRQQLLQQTGSHLLEGYATERQQLQALFDAAVTQAGAVGLEFGQPLTDEQQANLGVDMVWMVETEVNGIKVLAPVVYLSAATRAGIEQGAIISATDVNLNLSSLSNKGGSIGGSQSVNVTSREDIRNTGGSLKAGDVNLRSTEGDIINENLSNDPSGRGAIRATGELSVNAAHDITNEGAAMSAGGDTALKAGDNITFDTRTSFKGGMQDRHYDYSIEQQRSTLDTGGSLKAEAGKDLTLRGTDATVGHNANLKAGDTITLESSQDTHASGTKTEGSVVTEKTTTQAKTTLTVGGDLSADAGKDLTLKGADVSASGDADLKAGDDINVQAVHDTKETTSLSSRSGVGVGGGLWGSESTGTATLDKTAVGSTLKVGGAAHLDAGKTLKVEGSDVDAAGKLGIKAQDVKVVAAENLHTSTTMTSTTSILPMGTSSKNDSGAAATASANAEGHKASASASASANASNDSSVSFGKSETTTTTQTDITHKGATLKSGSDLSIAASKGVTFKGSSADAKGDLAVSGENIKVLSAEDTHTTTTHRVTTTVGIFSENSADAKAKAEADASGGSTKAAAEASAEAEAKSENTIGVQKQMYDSSTLDTKNQGSALTSGRDLSLKAKDQLEVTGSDLTAGRNADIDARDMSFKAAEDRHISSSTTTTTTAGLVVDAKAKAEASAEASASAHGRAGGKAEAEASAEAGIGAGIKHQDDAASEGTTTARVSTIKVGSDLTRTATGKIMDVGTDIEAGGNVTQSAREIESLAAHNTASSSSDSTTHKVKVGAYASASASAEAKGGTGAAKAEADANASVGGRIQYGYDQSSSSESSSQAVTSRIKAGGSISSTSTQKTTLEGTQLQAGKDVSLDAGSLDFKAAQDTRISHQDSTSVEATAKLGASATKAVDGSLEGEYKGGESESSESKAVSGSIDAGRNVSIKTRDNARFEGAHISAGNDAEIQAGGNVTFDAAQDTASSSKSSQNVEAKLSASKSGKGEKEMGFEAKGGAESSTSSSSQAVVGSIKSGGTLSVNAGKNASFEGTQMEAGGDAQVKAGGDVDFNTAKSTASSNGWNVSGELKLGKDSQALDAKGGYESGSESTSQAVTLKSGGNAAVQAGRDIRLEGSTLEATDTATLEAGRDVNVKAAVDTKKSFEVSAALSVSRDTGTDKKDDDGKKPATGESAAKKGDNVTPEVTGGTGFDVSVDADSETVSKSATVKGANVVISAGSKATLEAATAISAAGATVQQTGSGASRQFNARITVPAQLPPGRQIEARTTDGKALPSWLTFDSSTGHFTGKPPADFKGVIDVVVKVPQADGSVNMVPVKFDVK